MSKILKSFFVAAAAFSGCILFFGCENSMKDFEQITPKGIAVEEAKDVDILYTLGDKTKARLTAPDMLRHQETQPYIEFTKTVHSDFYDDSLQVESKLDAHYGKYLESESKVFLKDSVRVFNVQGDTLYCNELWWDRARTGQEFYTDKPVRIRTKTHILDGDGLDAPQDFNTWHLINGRGIVRVPASEFPQ